MTFTFSYSQKKYDEIIQGPFYRLEWSEEKTWRYENCNIKVIGKKNNGTLIVIRRKKEGYSSFMKSNFSVNLMMGFVAKETSSPHEEQIDGKKIWLINFKVEPYQDKDLMPLREVKIWSDVKDEIFTLHTSIVNSKKNENISEFFSSEVIKNFEIIPVIYQPKIDAWKNFLREVHVHHRTEKEFEVTLVFNDERLRMHSFFDTFYRIVRWILHKRIKDVETFLIYSQESPSHFTFPSIYSGPYTISHDNIHEDKIPQKRPIKYFYQDHNHPIVFINTSNHAMAPNDNNHDIWKWEYIPWLDEIPIKLGNKSRKEIDESFKFF